MPVGSALGGDGMRDPMLGCQVTSGRDMRCDAQPGHPGYAGPTQIMKIRYGSCRRGPGLVVLVRHARQPLDEGYDAPGFLVGYLDGAEA